MERAIRIDCFQNLVNYRKPGSFVIKESFPLPPYSTVIGMIHRICGFASGDYHPMKVSVQGQNTGSVSELYTRYAFSFDTKYESGRHNLCIEDDGKRYGAFKGIGYVELICNNKMVIHIVPQEEDFDFILEKLNQPDLYPSLGRHEDLLDIMSVKIVNLMMEDDEVACKNNIYIPIESKMDMGNRSATIYTLTKEYEITKQGMRRWKPEGGRIQSFYMPANTWFEDVLVDDCGDVVALA